MRIKTGGESTVFLNGDVMGGNSVAGWDNAQDIGGRLLTLTRKAKGGERFQVMVEGYADTESANAEADLAPSDARWCLSRSQRK
jgi:hypothetical protein